MSMSIKNKMLNCFFLRTPCDVSSGKLCRCGSLQGHPELAALVSRERKRRMEEDIAFREKKGKVEDTGA